MTIAGHRYIRSPLLWTHTGSNGELELELDLELHLDLYHDGEYCGILGQIGTVSVFTGCPHPPSLVIGRGLFASRPSAPDTTFGQCEGILWFISNSRVPRRLQIVAVVERECMVTPSPDPVRCSGSF